MCVFGCECARALCARIVGGACHVLGVRVVCVWLSGRGVCRKHVSCVRGRACVLRVSRTRGVRVRLAHVSWPEGVDRGAVHLHTHTSIHTRVHTCVSPGPTVPSGGNTLHTPSSWTPMGPPPLSWDSAVSSLSSESELLSVFPR